MADYCLICDPPADALILRSDRGIVLVDDPVRTGHVLVGATEHQDGLHALSPQSAGALLELARDVADVIVSKLGAEKVYVAAVGDKDKHFHVHLVPRFSDDHGLGPYIFGASGWVGNSPNMDGWAEDDGGLRSTLATLPR